MPVRAVFDHVTLGVSDIPASRAFYDRVMSTLGLPLMWHTETMLTYGIEGAAEFGLQRDAGRARHGTHVAFAAPDRETVDRFHAVGLAAGGRDAGAPGLRPEYHAGYYAGFVDDPDGNRIEAVFHDPAA